MFDTMINKTDAFPALPRDYSCLDESIYMTSFVLLYNRVENMELSCSFARNSRMPSLNYAEDPNVYSFIWFENGTPEGFLEQCKIDIKKLKEHPEHSKFLTTKLNQTIRVLSDPINNTVYVFTTSLTLKAWHLVQSFFPVYFQIFKEKPITKEEKDYLLTLTNKTPNDYCLKLAVLTNTKEFNDYILKDMIAGFEKKLYKSKLTNAKNYVKALEDIMDQALEKYKTACEKHLEALANVYGLEHMMENVDEHTELQNYLTTNNSLFNVRLEDTKIKFIVKTLFMPHYLDDWDLISKALKERASSGPFQSQENVKMLLDGFLSTRKCLKLKMCAYFEMDYFGASATSIRHYDFAKAGLKGYIPNPHLDKHNCFDENKVMMLEQLKQGDAIGAIECAIACAQRVNYHEGFTFVPFINDVINSNEKIFVAPDGQELTPQEALNYLKARKTNE